MNLDKAVVVVELGCNHAICEECAKTILKSTKKCPKCKRDVDCYDVRVKPHVDDVLVEEEESKVDGRKQEQDNDAPIGEEQNKE
jgi:hypothetical protein